MPSNVLQLGDSFKGGIVYHQFVDSGTAYALIVAPVNEYRQNNFSFSNIWGHMLMKLYGYYGPSGLINTSADSTALTDGRSGNTTALYNQSAPGQGTTATYPDHIYSAMNHIWTNKGNVAGLYVAQNTTTSLNGWENGIVTDADGSYTYIPREDGDQWFIPNITQLQKLYEYLNDSSLHNVADEYRRLGFLHPDYIDGYTSTPYYRSSTENPNNQSQELQAINFGTANNYNNIPAGGITMRSKTDWGLFRAIRIIEVPPAACPSDIDGSDINENTPIVFNDLALPTALPYFEHNTILPAVTEENQKIYWYSSFIKFSAMSQTNTAASIFGSIDKIVSVRYTNSGGIDYVYYKSGAAPQYPDQALTTLTDGGVYRIEREIGASVDNIILNGEVVQNSSNVNGFSFNIPSGESYISWPISQTVNINDIFGFEDAPDFRDKYTYLIAGTSDLSNSKWGPGGRVNTSGNIGSGFANSINIMTAFNSSTAAHVADAYSIVDSGTTYNDWFLPAIKTLERMVMYVSLSSGQRYWSSTASGNRNAFFWDTLSESFYETTRGSNYKVRPVRTAVSFNNKKLGDPFQAGTVINKIVKPESRIEYINDNIGNTWRPFAVNNTLTVFKPGQAYFIKTTTNFSFNHTTQNTATRGRNINIDFVSDEWDEDNQAARGAFMKFTVNGDVLQAAINQIPEHSDHLAARTGLYNKYTHFAAGNATIMAFASGKPFETVWNTLLGLDDTYSSASGVYNNKAFKSDWEQIKRKILAANFKYKIVFEDSSAIIKGSSTSYKSTLKGKALKYDFKVIKPTHKSNVIVFTIFTGDAETDKIAFSRFKFDLLDKKTNTSQKAITFVTWEANKKYILSNPIHVSTTEV